MPRSATRPWTPLAGAVSGYSVTSGSTSAVGTVADCSATSASAVRAPAVAAPSGCAGRTSMVTVRAAGVRTATTTASANSCWHSVTNRPRRVRSGISVGYGDMIKLQTCVAGKESHE